MTIETQTDKSEVGFLPHEARFVIYSLERASKILKDANLEYGDAVSQSGGDWAFDDSTARDAALNAHQKEQRVRRFRELQEMLLAYGEIDYPAIDLEPAIYGSRVSLIIGEGDGRSDRPIYDLGTHYIPDIPTEEKVRTINPGAAIGSVLLGTVTGDTVSWCGPKGRNFTARVLRVDQQAVKNFYSRFTTE